MRKPIYFVLVLIFLLAGCNKSTDIVEVAPIPEPEATGMVTAAEFLKAFKVTGAKQIKFDSAGSNYIVSLPDTYNEKYAQVKLSMQRGILLIDSLDKPSADSIILYSYKARAPLRFQLRNKTEKRWMYFSVYFNFSGTPEIELLQKEIPIDASGIKLPLRFNAKVGSIPSGPEQMGPRVKITNRKTGFFTETNISEGNPVIYLESAQNLITEDPMTLEIQLNNQNPVVFEGVKFTRAAPVLRVVPTYKFQYTYQDTLKVAGGYFLPQEQYKVAISSDFLPDVFTAALRVVDAGTLTLDRIPAGLPEGSYLLSFYEKDKLLGKGSFYVSASETRCIETIWKGDINGALSRNVLPLVLKKGDVFYAKSLPLEFGRPEVNLTAGKLPQLRLKSSGRTLELAPELAIYNWAIAGVSYSLGKYTLPADLASGRYQVTGIYADKTETKPYWSFLEVK
jgi:hypothetical protein